MDSQDDLLIKDAQRPKSPLWEKVVIIVLAFVGVGLLGTVVAYIAGPANGVDILGTGTVQDQERKAVVVQAMPLKGTLLASVNVISSAGVHLMESGLIETATDKTAPSPVDQLDAKQVLTQQYNISPGFEYITFLGLSEDDQDGASWNIHRTQIHKLDDLSFIVATVESNSQSFKGNDEDYFREFPAVSTEGVVVYSSISKQAYTDAGTNLHTLPAESWNIYAIAQDGSKTKLIQGLRPKWINPTTFAYLKNDGVYVLNTNLMKERKVFATESANTLVQGFDVSNDARYFAVTDPENTKVIIVNVLDWGTGIIAPVIEIPVAASNPVFAPDNSYLAMVNLEENEADES